MAPTFFIMIVFGKAYQTLYLMISLTFFVKIDVIIKAV